MGCGTPGQLKLRPLTLDWGEVDFLQDMPSGGYGRTEIILENTGEGTLEMTLLDVDLGHLCLEGYLDSMLPSDLPELDAGQSYSLFVGVCAYDVEGGERDTTVSSDLLIDTPEGELALPWSFVPVLGVEE